MKMKCKLCKINVADQTGSHITSAFLLTSQIGKRGEEKEFLITTNPDQDYTINQGGKGLIEDNIFCRDCEKRMGIVESLFATEITHKIEKKQFEQNFVRKDYENSEFYELHSKRLNPIVFQLLIQLNIWRASISTQPLYSLFKINDDLEERIRFNLDLFLPTITNFKISQSTNEWINSVDFCNTLFDFIPIAVIKAENIENKEITYEYYDNVSKTPYHIILNEYFILVFNNNQEWTDNFFNLKEDFNKRTIINKSYSEPIIGIVTNERYFKTINKIKGLAVNQRLVNTKKHIIEESYREKIPITYKSFKKKVNEKVNRMKM